jgi:hypothetical protein
MRVQNVLIASLQKEGSGMKKPPRRHHKPVAERLQGKM